MVYNYCFDARKLKLDDFKDFINILKTEELKKFNSFKVTSRKIEFLVGRLMTRYFFKLYLCNNYKDIEILYSDHGKPYCNDNFYFNISHSKGVIVFSFSFLNPVGVDIEYIDNICDKYTLSIFTENERNLLEDNVTKEISYIYFWTLKEALVKAFGMGFTILPNKLDTTNVRFNNELYSKETYFLESYIVTIVSRNGKKNDDFSKLYTIDLDDIRNTL